MNTNKRVQLALSGCDGEAPQHRINRHKHTLASMLHCSEATTTYVGVHTKRVSRLREKVPPIAAMRSWGLGASSVVDTALPAPAPALARADDSTAVLELAATEVASANKWGKHGDQ